MVSEKKQPFTFIDLFSGAGGMTLGFTEAFGNLFKPVWANDIDKHAVATYNANFGSHCIEGDIISLLHNPAITIPQADVVIGGPPCQGFSLLNKDRANDFRKQMWKPFMEIVKRANARIFIIENVPQLLDSPEHEAIARSAEALGFKLTWNKLCAADFGVPQVRWRAFIIGSRSTDPALFFPPKKTHYNPKTVKHSLFDEYIDNKRIWRTVKDAIEDLPEPIGTDIHHDISPPLDLHFRRSPTQISIKRYMTIPEEGMNRFDLQRLAPELTPECWIKKTSGGTDLFGRLWWDRPACTIRTEFFKPEKGRYLHPSQHRPITHREAARFQTFPDTFRFCGNKLDIARQIGNAVPPLLAAKIAECVYNLLCSQDDRLLDTPIPTHNTHLQPVPLHPPL